MKWQRTQQPPGNVHDIVLNVLGVEGRVRGNELDFVCPVHNDRRPSAAVNLESGLWHCFSCGAGGNLVSLAAVIKGVDFSTAQRLVQPHTPTALSATLQRTTYGRLAAIGGNPPQAPLPMYPPSTPQYLIRRGYTKETLATYGVGYVKDEVLTYDKDRTIAIKDYVAIPIRDEANHLMAWCYRACHQTKLRYLYTPGVRISDLWFGMNLHRYEDEVIVTEGALDSMWVHQCGFPAVAMLGASNRGEKLSLLTQHKKVTLFLDRDPAGVMALQDVGDKICPRTAVWVVRYPRGVDAKDPADLTPEQVKRAIERAVPYAKWRNP